MKLKISALILFFAAVLALAGCGKTVVPVIKNASFDKDAAGWKQNSYSPDGASVEYGAESGGSVCISAQTENDVRLIQLLDVSPNTSYKITCDVKTEGVTGGAGANIGVYGIAVTGEQVLGDTDWHSISLTGKTADKQTELPLSIGVGSHGALSSGKAWFDNVRIELSDGATKLLGKNSSQKDEADRPTKFPTEQILLAWCISSAVFLAIVVLYRVSARKPLRKDKTGGSGYVLIILALALAVRVALSLIFYGHKTDIGCFTAWGNRVISAGTQHFYDQWCDYPPGYMYVLGLMSWINKLVGGGSAVHALLVKLPCIAADLGGAYLIYRLAKKAMSRNSALLLMAVFAFTPVVAYVSSAWGQIDQVLTILIAVPIILLYARLPITAGLLLGLAVAVKPQALMVGPLFAAACLVYVIKGSPDKDAKPKGLNSLFRNVKSQWAIRLIEVVLGTVGAFVLIFLLSLPFRGDQSLFWVVGKYKDTATSYNYASVNAYNFWALIGANWKSTDTAFLGLTYGKWGTVAIAFFVVTGVALYLFAAFRHDNPKGALPLALAYTLAGIFTFGHYMHERYVFPVLMLLLLAYLFYNERLMLWSYAAYAVTMLLNCICAFYYSALHEYGLYWDTKLVFGCSLANVVLFALFMVLTFVIMLGNRPKRGYNG